MGLKVLVTGVTGMVGEGVMLECLENPAIEKVLAVTRRTTGHAHPKLTELVVRDFTDVGAHEAALTGWDACFYGAGISSVGMSEADYTKVTYDTPLRFAEVLARLNPSMVMVHVSGRATDSTERGRVMWARVKGRAENALMKLPFRGVYNMRPALMKPVAGQRAVKGTFRAVLWFWPIWNALFPGSCMTLNEVGRAMIKCVTDGAPKQVLEVSDMQELVRGSRQR